MYLLFFINFTHIFDHTVWQRYSSDQSIAVIRAFYVIQWCALWCWLCKHGQQPYHHTPNKFWLFITLKTQHVKYNGTRQWKKLLVVSEWPLTSAVSSLAPDVCASNRSDVLVSIHPELLAKLYQLLAKHLACLYCIC